MQPAKKQKTVTWHTSVSKEDYTTNTGKLDKHEPNQKSDILTESDKNFATKEIQFHLDYLFIELLIFKLTSYRKKNKLYALLKHDNFNLFDWALDKNNLMLIDYLFKNLKKNQCFVMLSHQNFASIKKFIAISKNTEWHDVERNSFPILKLILQSNCGELSEIICNYLSDESLPFIKETNEKLLNFVNQIESNQNSTIEGASDFEEQSEDEKNDNITIGPSKLIV